MMAKMMMMMVKINDNNNYDDNYDDNDNYDNYDDDTCTPNWWCLQHWLYEYYVPLNSKLITTSLLKIQ